MSFSLVILVRTALQTDSTFSLSRRAASMTLPWKRRSSHNPWKDEIVHIFMPENENTIGSRGFLTIERELKLKLTSVQKQRFVSK